MASDPYQPLKDAFIDWLLIAPDLREPKSQAKLADLMGIAKETLTRWKQDADFLREWERRYKATVANPEKMQRVMEALYQSATDPMDPKFVQSARAYMEGVDRLMPQVKTQRHILEAAPAAAVYELSDADLAAAAAALESGE